MFNKLTADKARGNIWDFGLNVSRDLMRWNMVNIAAGVLLISRRGFWRGFGSQNIGWGLINIGIATVGGRAMRQRHQKTGLNPITAHQHAKQEASNLKRILLVNAGLDVLYMLGGWRFAHSRNWNERREHGIGLGIVLQGGLLLIFDLWKASRVPVK